MAIGVKIRNSNLITLIDDRFSNLMLRQKIAGSRPTYSAVNRSYLLSLSITCTQDALIAYRCTGGFSGIVNYVTQSGTQRKIEFSSYNDFTVDVFVFDLAPYAILKGTIALIIRNRVTGEKVFDSRGRYMKILGYLTVSAFPNSGNYDVFNGVDKLPACVPLQPYLYDWASTFDAGGSPVAESGGDNMQTLCDGNTIRAKIEEWRYRTGGGGGLSYDNYSGSKVLMFLDVTGI